MPTPAEVFAHAAREYQSGRLREAESICRQMLSVNPDDASATQLLGIIAHRSGDIAAGIDLMRRAAGLNPSAADIQSNLGSMLAGSGQLSEAVGAFTKAVELRPDLPEPRLNLAKLLINLGTQLHARGQFSEAERAYRQAAAALPNAPEPHVNLGIVLLELGRTEEAVASLRHAITLQPNHADAWYYLAGALRKSGQLDEAVEAFNQCIRIKPDHADAVANLGNTLRDRGQLDEAIDHFRRAMTLTTASWPAESLIYSLYFHPDYDAPQILAEHRKWNDVYAKPIVDEGAAPSSPSPFGRGQGEGELRAPQNTLPSPGIPGEGREGVVLESSSSSTSAQPVNPDRRLRIAYLSPDFRHHCQANFTIPLLSNHDRSRVEVFCYSSVRRPDDMTTRIRQLADVWRDISTLSDDAAADLIRNDAIDILVDLSMHMDQSRILVFARKPAPVQITWLAYPGTTGLETMDYRLTDPRLDPPTIDRDALYSEKTIRLPDTFWCYDPLTDCPPINDLPALRNGYLTFGCLNNFAKITSPTLDLWAAIMNQLPTSRLIVLTRRGWARETLLKNLAARGIDPTRVEPIDRMSREAYLAAYNRFDLCLDTFPYNGHTTTLDALWMGVPPITLAGQTAVSRGGLSILHNINLSDLVSTSSNQAAEIAHSLATNLPRLSQLRASLRQTMQSSPLMNAPLFARNMENAFRSAWAMSCGPKKDDAAV